MSKQDGEEVTAGHLGTFWWPMSDSYALRVNGFLGSQGWISSKFFSALSLVVTCRAADACRAASR